ncbi:MAG: MarR family transcriptional regulator [Chitinophagales bacterium]|nr:MarR family transcriptional regulator [Chitinophagales bacterium]
MTSNIESRYHKAAFSGFRIEKTVKLMKLTLSRLFSQHPELDTTVDQWVIMYLLNQHELLSQQEIAEHAFKDAPTVTRMIDLMEAKNLVQRLQDASDKRRLMIRLTALGKEKFMLMEPIVEDFRAAAYDGLEEAQLLQLDKTLNIIFNNLSKIH